MATIPRETRKKTATIKETELGPRGGLTRYRFPINNPAHARNALARLNQAKGLSDADREKIVRKAFRVLGWPDKEHPETVEQWLRAHPR